MGFRNDLCSIRLDSIHIFGYFEFWLGIFSSANLFADLEALERTPTKKMKDDLSQLSLLEEGADIDSIFADEAFDA